MKSAEMSSPTEGPRAPLFPVLLVRPRSVFEPGWIFTAGLHPRQEGGFGLVSSGRAIA